jgi:hypothetical protein
MNLLKWLNNWFQILATSFFKLQVQHFVLKNMFGMVFNLIFFVKNLKMRGLNLEANIMDIHEPTILFLLMHDSCVGQPWAYANC